MATLFTQWSTDDSIYAIVMRGADEKSFCGGGEIRALRESAFIAPRWDSNHHPLANLEQLFG